MKFKEWFKRLFRRRPRYGMTPKGICFVEYLKDLQQGKDVFIEAYDKTITSFAERFSITHDAAASRMLTVLNLFPQNTEE
jgi:hypothetical protein